MCTTDIGCVERADKAGLQDHIGLRAVLRQALQLHRVIDEAGRGTRPERPEGGPLPGGAGGVKSPPAGGLEAELTDTGQCDAVAALRRVRV